MRSNQELNPGSVNQWSRPYATSHPGCIGCPMDDEATELSYREWTEVPSGLKAVQALCQPPQLRSFLAIKKRELRYLNIEF
jgi:hypothetical protein